MVKDKIEAVSSEVVESYAILSQYREMAGQGIIDVDTTDELALHLLKLSTASARLVNVMST